MFPVHWGTFNLAFHAWDEPIERALAAARAGQVELLTPRVGEMVNADQAFASSAWWRALR
jgi:L-ascorbate metabolism protein UlaG (beta-lactamase superfamily)